MFDFDENTSLDSIIKIAQDFKSQIKLSEKCLEKIRIQREKLTEILRSGEVVYGINTGFGLLSNVRIPNDQLQLLQENLIKSHAVGLGDCLPLETIRTMLLLRLKNCLQPESAVSENVAKHLEKCFNAGIVPVVPKLGSVGASGDLAPLAHLACLFTGDGDGFDINVQKRIPLRELLQEKKCTPPALGAKEGLGLINGTQAINSIGGIATQKAKELLSLSHVIASLSLEGFKGSKSPFDIRIAKARPHRGHRIVAEHFQKILGQTTDILQSHLGCDKVQDPYSFRCIPQVHGAAVDALTHTWETLVTEANGCTDNPLLVGDNEIISGGNFHGQPLALVLDYAAMALTTVASMAERRIEKLTNPAFSGLPAFLVKNPGVNSGFMIIQVAAAAIVNRMKHLSNPCSIDSIPTSADKEDHVSMGMNSALKFSECVTNFNQVLTLELLTGAQALDFHRPLKSSPAVEWIYQKIRSQSAFVEQDRFLSKEIGDIEKALGTWAKENPWPMGWEQT